MIPGLERIEEYATAATSAEPEVLRRLREETCRTREIPYQIAGPLQGRLLALLTRLSGARRVLEIGAFVGYSALCFWRRSMARRHARGACAEQRLDTLKGHSPLQRNGGAG